MKTSLFRSLFVTTLLGVAAAGSLCAMNNNEDDTPWGKQAKEAIANEIKEIQPSAKEWVFYDRNMIGLIASFLFGDERNHDTHKKFIAFLEKYLENPSLPRINKAWYTTLQSLANKNYVIIRKLLLMEQPNDFLSQIVKSKAYKTMRIALKEFQDRQIPLASFRFDHGDNLLHLAAQENNRPLFELIRSHAPELANEFNTNESLPLQTFPSFFSKIRNISHIKPALILFLIAGLTLLSTSFFTNNLPSYANHNPFTKHELLKWCVASIFMWILIHGSNELLTIKDH